MDFREQLKAAIKAVASGDTQPLKDTLGVGLNAKALQTIKDNEPELLGEGLWDIAKKAAKKQVEKTVANAASAVTKKVLDSTKPGAKYTPRGQSVREETDEQVDEAKGPSEDELRERHGSEGGYTPKGHVQKIKHLNPDHPDHAAVRAANKKIQSRNDKHDFNETKNDVDNSKEHYVVKSAHFKSNENPTHSGVNKLKKIAGPFETHELARAEQAKHRGSDVFTKGPEGRSYTYHRDDKPGSNPDTFYKRLSPNHKLGGHVDTTLHDSWADAQKANPHMHPAFKFAVEE